MGNEILNESISVAEPSQSFSQLQDQLFMIDLMNREDFAARHIPGAINIHWRNWKIMYKKFLKIKRLLLHIKWV